MFIALVLFGFGQGIMPAFLYKPFNDYAKHAQIAPLATPGFFDRASGQSIGWRLLWVRLDPSMGRGLIFGLLLYRVLMICFVALAVIGALDMFIPLGVPF